MSASAIPCGDRVHVEWIHQDRRASGDLLHRSSARRDDGRSGRHRLEHRQAESLVERRIENDTSASIGSGELCVRELADPPGDVHAAPPPRAHDAELGAGAARGLDHAAEILARLERRHGEDVISVRSRPVGGEDLVDAVRDDTDPLRGNPGRNASSRVNSETATTASAARSTERRPAFPYSRCQRGKASGARRRARSWTVSTVGIRGLRGPRNVVQ